jgi:hypothetical protein
MIAELSSLARQWAEQAELYSTVAERNEAADGDLVGRAIMATFGLAYRTAAHQLFAILKAHTH